MAELGALSSYALSVQQMQMSLIKNSVEMQTHGHNVDISV